MTDEEAGRQREWSRYGIDILLGKRRARLLAPAKTADLGVEAAVDVLEKQAYVRKDVAELAAAIVDAVRKADGTLKEKGLARLLKRT